MKDFPAVRASWVPRMTAGLLLSSGAIACVGAFSNDVSALAAGLLTTQAPAAVAVSTLHAPKPPNHTAGVELTLDEVQREPGGPKGTRVTYRLKTSGFPRDKVYRLKVSGLSTKPMTWLTDIRTDDSGSLANGKIPKGTSIELAKLTFMTEDYNDGEFYMVEVNSEDGTVYAADRVFPFPIAAQDGNCRVWAALAAKNRKSFVIMGSGFGANSVIKTASWEDDGKDLKESNTEVDSNDLFGAIVEHRKSGGVGGFSATGNSCSVKLQYAFGKHAKGPR